MRYLSIDAGGTLIKYAWINDLEEIVSMGEEPTPRDSREAFQDVIQRIWDGCEEEKGGIAMSLPGTINADTGFIYQGGSLSYHSGWNIKEAYEKTFSTSVSVENDARCATIAEMQRGVLQGIANGIVLTFGTGVGGCFIIDHHIYKGTHLFSGEVSMLVCKDIAHYGLDAVFGNIGGIPNLIHRICEAKHVADTDGKTVFEWIKAKDEVATNLFTAYCADIAIQLFNMQLMLDPEIVCIGGGVSENPVFMDGISKALQAFYQRLPIQIPPLTLACATYHNQANLLGAFYHFQQEHK